MKFYNLSLEDQITVLFLSILLLILIIHGYNIDSSVSAEQSILDIPVSWVS